MTGHAPCGTPRMVTKIKRPPAKRKRKQQPIPADGPARRRRKPPMRPPRRSYP